MASTTLAVDAMLRRHGVLVAYPRVVGDAPLELSFATPGSLVPAGRFQIPEPAIGAERVAPDHIDLVLVPALAFDRRGYRLGFGKGHYDRLLALATRAVRFGACLPHQLMPAVPDEPHDVPLDFLVVAGAGEGRILAAAPRRFEDPVHGPRLPKESL